MVRAIELGVKILAAMNAKKPSMAIERTSPATVGQCHPMPRVNSANARKFKGICIIAITSIPRLVVGNFQRCQA